MTVDLVCWDFGDTLVDEMFMRLAPPGVPDWAQAYERALADDPGFAERCDLGKVSLADLVHPIASELPSMPRAEILRHLRTVWHRIDWFPESARWIERFDGEVLQAIVTVNPHEFHGIAVACGLDRLVDVMVTSADVESLSKPVMARRARRLLGLGEDLSTSLLIDNKAHNVDDFIAAGGQALLFARDTIDGELSARFTRLG